MAEAPPVQTYRAMDTGPAPPEPGEESCGAERLARLRTLVLMCLVCSFFVCMQSIGQFYFRLFPTERPRLSGLGNELRQHGFKEAPDFSNGSHWEPVEYRAGTWIPWMLHLRVQPYADLQNTVFVWACAGGPEHTLCHDARCGTLRVSEGNRTGFFLTVAGELLDSTEALPQACIDVEEHDQVKRLDGECSDFCEALFGKRPPFEVLTLRCGHESGDGIPAFVLVANRVCNKVRLARTLEPLRPVSVRFAIAVAYSLFGLLWAFACCYSSEQQEREVASGARGLREGVTESPDLTKCAFPLCFLDSPSDRGRALRQIGCSVPMSLLDNTLDVLAGLNFALRGQAYFAIATLFSIALARDVFQARAYRAALATWRRGFPGKSWLEHQVHEGGQEAPMAGYIALASVAVGHPGSMYWQSAVLLVFSGFCSIAVAIPGAVAAAALLGSSREADCQCFGDPWSLVDEAEAVVDDYARQEARRRALPCSLRFGPSMRVMGMVAWTQCCAWTGMSWVGFFVSFSCLLAIAVGGHMPQRLAGWRLPGVFLVLSFAALYSLLGSHSAFRTQLRLHAAAATAGPEPLTSLLQLMLLPIGAAAFVIGFFYWTPQQADARLQDPPSNSVGSSAALIGEEKGPA